MGMRRGKYDVFLPRCVAHRCTPTAPGMTSYALAWDYGLRGYDAVQLASAITWQEAVATEILLTFDQQPLRPETQRDTLHVKPLPRNADLPLLQRRLGFD